jgi:hypothetical protein
MTEAYCAEGNMLMIMKHLLDWEVFEAVEVAVGGR